MEASDLIYITANTFEYDKVATYADPPRMRSPGRGYGPPPPIDRPSRPYKVLCVSALHPKASDDVVRDTLYREYKKYGDISCS